MTNEERFDACLKSLNGPRKPVEDTPEGRIAFIRGYLKAINGTEFDIQHWCALEAITPHEAAILLLGGDPQYGDKGINEGRRKRLEQRLTAHNAVHPKHRSWREWHQVAKGIGADYERGFDSFFASMAQPAIEEVAQPQAAAPVQTGSADDGNEWKEQARQRACEIIARQRARDLYPSQEVIADEIAREFRAAGKPWSGAYIKRHALKGITSEAGKQLSTSIHRGK